MAYSNWGAFVYENGERRTDKEDVSVFDTDREKFPDDGCPWYAYPHHAVLGDNDVRLCGYKNNPELWICRDGPERIKITPEYHDDIKRRGSINIDGKTWEYSFEMYDGNMVDLMLVEPDGTEWTATCGYCYGAGHMED